MLFLESSNRNIQRGGDRIRLESENYFFYLNSFGIKEEFKNNTKVLEIVKDLESFFEFKVAEVLSVDSSGKPNYLYKIAEDVILPPDQDHMEVRGLRLNHGSGSHNYETIIGEFGLSIKDKYRKLSDRERSEKYTDMLKELNSTFKNILDKYFNYGIPGRQTYIEFKSSNTNCEKFRKKRKVGKQWNLSHQNSYGSKIEEILGEALKKRDIKFISQQKIFYGGKLFTIPDFYIEESNLAVYCDGFQYHYDKDTVIKDRQQDRILQLLGYRVLRFTGSEIVGNINDCVNEVLLFINTFKNLKDV